MHRSPALVVVVGISKCVSAAATWTLGANLENLTLTGSGSFAGTGNTLSNQITGNGGNNILTGAGGNDTLLGGGGIDSLLGGAANLGSYALALWAMTRAPVAAVAALRETSILFAVAIAGYVLHKSSTESLCLTVVSCPYTFVSVIGSGECR